MLRVVEWSKCFDFAVVEGSFVLSDLTHKLDTHSHSLEYNIPDLVSVSIVIHLLDVLNVFC